MKRFLDLFVDAVKNLKTGNPKEKEVDVGPLILPREVDRVAEWVKEAIREGAECKFGGYKISDTIFEPTILTNVTSSSKVAKNEIFGPVVLVQSFQNFEDAIAQANDVDFAFQASIFTQNLNRALTASQELEGLSIMVNEHTAFRVDWMPFGGYKKSGLGTGGIGHYMKDLSIERMFVVKSDCLI